MNDSMDDPTFCDIKFATEGLQQLQQQYCEDLKDNHILALAQEVMAKRVNMAGMAGKQIFATSNNSNHQQIDSLPRLNTTPTSSRPIEFRIGKPQEPLFSLKQKNQLQSY
jgi:hypothetical protein